MIGKIIKYMRIEKGYTQEKMAKIINIGQSSLSDYENGKSTIDFELIEEIAKECDYEIIFRNPYSGNIVNSDTVERKEK